MSRATIPEDRVEEIRKRSASGQSTRAIAAWLCAEGVECTHGAVARVLARKSTGAVAPAAVRKSERTKRAERTATGQREAPPPAPPSHSRARNAKGGRRASDLITVEERVRFIVRRMARAKWTRLDAPRLAKIWGVDKSTVAHHAAEASRHFKVDPAEREAARNELAAWFRGVAERALKSKNEITGLPEFKSAIDAMNRYGEYVGIGPLPVAFEPPSAPTRVVVVFEDECDTKDKPPTPATSE